MTGHELRKFFKRYMKVPDKNKAHAVLSASGSERWLNCPGSIRESEGVASVDGEWSVRGTQAHTLLQFILENPEHWRHLLAFPEAQSFLRFIDYSGEQRDAVRLAAHFVWAERDRMHKQTGVKPTLMVEQKLELEGVGFGTADIVLYQPFDVLHVIDYKNGRGVVEAEENTQGLYYAYAAADKFGWDFSDVWITIIQPNANHKRGPIRTWKTTPKRLEEAGHRFRHGAARTRLPNAPLVVDSKHCWFCPARQKCPAQMKLKTGAIMHRFKKESQYED